MADTPETKDIDTDSMSMEEISSLKGKMTAGEDIAKPEPQPEPTNSGPAPDHDDEEAALAAAEAEPAAETDKGSKTVPHKTFNYANERRKAAERAAQEANERYARLEERTKMLLEAQQQPQTTAAADAPAEEAIPDPDKDPVGAVKWLKSQIEARSKAEAEQREQSERLTQKQQQFQQVYEQVNNDYTAATAADPQVVEAHNALRASVAQELTEVYGYTQQEALKELVRQENQHLINIANSGADVGDYIKKLAKTRGWRPAAPAADPTPTPANNKLEQARQAGASLGTSGGAVANSGKITPDMLADMPEAEFQEYMKKHGSTRGAFAA